MQFILVTKSDERRLQGFLQARFFWGGGGRPPPPKKNQLLTPKIFTDFIFNHPEPPYP